MTVIRYVILLAVINLPVWATNNMEINVSLSFSIPDTQSLLSTHAWYLADNLTSKLVYLDNTGKIEPFIAKTWKISADAKIYTFFLDEDAKFSDGTPITANDVAFTFKRLILLDYKLHYPIRSIIAYAENPENIEENFKGIEVLNKHTVQFRLTKYIKEFLFFLSLADSGIIHRTSIQSKLKISNYRISSGAYYIPNENKPKLSYNPFFLLGQEPHFKSINITRVGTEISNRNKLNSIIKKEADIAYVWLTPNDIIHDDIGKNNFVTFEGALNFSHYFLINTKKYNKQERIHIAADLLLLLKYFQIQTSRFQKKTCQYIPDFMLGSLESNKASTLLNNNLKKNKNKESNKYKIIIWDTYSDSSASFNLGNLNKIINQYNLPFSVAKLDRKEFFESGINWDFDVKLLLVSLSEKYIDSCVKFMLSTDVYNKSTLYNNLWNLYKKGLIAENKAQKAEYYRKISEMLLTEAVIVPIAYTAPVYITQPDIKLRNFNPYDFKLEFWNIYR